MKKIFFYLWITLMFLSAPIIALAYGGGYAMPVAPTVDSASLIINSGGTTTSSTSVTLALSASGASQMAVSNTSDFLNAAWETYSTSKNWVLTTGEGPKTIYVKFKSAEGGISSVVSKSITLTGVQLQNQPDMNGDGSVNDFDFSILMSNWGNPQSAEADLNKDGRVDDFDFSILMSNWSL